MFDTSNVTAIIVVYNSDFEKLNNLVRTLAKSLSEIIIFDNSPDKEMLIDTRKCSILTENENIGIGKAINIASTYAISRGYEYIFTFDQDSQPCNDFVEGMISSYICELEKGNEIACISPSFIDARDKLTQYHDYSIYSNSNSNSNSNNELELTLQSGMLINLKLLEYFPFNENFIIEFVDTEWCLRLRNQSHHKIYRSETVALFHELSDTIPRKLCGYIFLNYSPIRRFFFYRNALFLMRCDYVPIKYKISLLSGMLNRFVSILIYENRMESMKMMLKGVWHGIKK